MPDYRLYPDVTFPAFVEDGALAVKWAHEHAAQIGGDSSRVYLMGHSAGAHIAALLTLDGHYLHDVGLDRTAIRATIGLAGPYDFVPKPEAGGVFGPHPGDAIEPISFVDGHQPPMLLVTGLKDTIVEPENTLHLAARIREPRGRCSSSLTPRRITLTSHSRWPTAVSVEVSGVGGCGEVHSGTLMSSRRRPSVKNLGRITDQRSMAGPAPAGVQFTKRTEGSVC